MSWLAPLYIAGVLAVSLPVLFHLIRRTPKGKMPFSSLMFLTPSPPRLTRRSRLDDWLLLLLRGLALTLLALAFARPFLRDTANLGLDAVAGRRLALVVDTSASMRRDGLWKDALAAAEEVVKDLTPADQVALYVFDEDVRTLVSFDDASKLDPARRAALLRESLEETTPTWASTNLGGALVTVADALDAAGEGQLTSLDTSLQIILISDLQQGSRLELLGGFQWPERVQVDLKSIAPREPTNAGLQVVAALEESQNTPDQLRVRVTNAADSNSEQFELRWLGHQMAGDHVAGHSLVQPVSVYVPPGQSRVVKMHVPDLGADGILLSGDGHEFDNTLYLAPQARQEISIVYLGDESSDDAQSLRYYLERAFPETPRRAVQVTALSADQPLLVDPTADVRLIVVAAAISPDRADQLRRYLSGGGTVLVVLKEATAARGLAELLGQQKLEIVEADSNQYAMLADIDFGHSLFAGFADPRFNDFTKIHFWKHRRITLEREAAAEVLARFDSGDPALIEFRVGDGHGLLLASGWHPADSELALSTKFVPWMDAILQRAGSAQVIQAAYHVNQRVAFPQSPRGGVAPAVYRPDGSEAELPTGARNYQSTDQPGIYHIRLAGTRQPFAVNLSPAESMTAPLPVAELEQRGVRLGRPMTIEEATERRRQMLDTELERRQHIWRWLIVAALVVLAVETLVAGRLARHRGAQTQPTGAVA